MRAGLGLRGQTGGERSAVRGGAGRPQVLACRDWVVDLTAELGLAQSTVSKHLACLRDCGLVAFMPHHFNACRTASQTGQITCRACLATRLCTCLAAHAA